MTASSLPGSAHLRHGVRSKPIAATRNYTHSDIFRIAALSDGHICSESHVGCVCVPSAALNCRRVSVFTEVSDTDQTAPLKSGDDGQRLMVIAMNRGRMVSILREYRGQIPKAQCLRIDVSRRRGHQAAMRIAK
jgi:hypothetical protein